MSFSVKMLIVVVILAIFCIPIEAKEPDDHIKDFEEIMPDNIAESSVGASELSSLVGFDSLLGEIACALGDKGGRILSFFIMLMGGVILLVAASMLSSPLSSTAQTALGVVISLLIFSHIGSIFSQIFDSLTTLSNFFSAFVPIATAVTAASGGVKTAMIQNGGMNLTLWLLGGVGTSFFTSVVGFSLAMSLISSFGDEGSLRVARGVKRFFVFCVGTVSAILGATLSLQTVVASAADSAAIRAARYAANGFIPVVGAAVSGALSTLVSGLTYAKEIIGVGGVAVILITALSPLVMLLLYRFAILCAAAFAELLGSEGAVRIISSFTFSLDSMIALYTSCALIYIIEIVMFMRGGVSLG